MRSGERRTENGERRTENGERRTENDWGELLERSSPPYPLQELEKGNYDHGFLKFWLGLGDKVPEDRSHKKAKIREDLGFFDQ